MLADHQTTDGYTKIANVISVDIPSVAQKKPRDRLTFEKVSIEEAQTLYRERKQQLEQLKRHVQRSHDVPHTSRLRCVCPDEHLNRSSETHDVHSRLEGDSNKITYYIYNDDQWAEL